jgi:hypothetical protein
LFFFLPSLLLLRISHMWTPRSWLCISSQFS